MEICVHPAEKHVRDDRGPPPIVSSGVDAVEEHLTLDWSAKSARAMRNDADFAGDAPGSWPTTIRTSWGLPAFVDSSPSVSPGHGQGTMQIMFCLSRDCLPCHAEVAVPPVEGPPQFGNQRNVPTRDTLREQVAAHGPRLRAFAEEKWYRGIGELPSKFETHQAYEYAHVQYTRWHLVVWHALRNGTCAEVQASHHAGTAAACGTREPGAIDCSEEFA